MSRTTLGAVLTIALAAGCTPSVDEGKATYTEFCAGCHGVGGHGDGPLAADLARSPADLTMLSAKNGGTFPQVEVMSVIDGYGRTDQGVNPMPEFGDDLHSRMLLVDTGDGVLTPTPERLAALTDYLRSLQQ